MSFKTSARRVRLPQYIFWLGRIRKNAAFQEIDSKLEATEEGKSKIYPVLSLRFWCHAHVYFPVFSFILADIIGHDKTALTLLMVSLGSLSFAVCDSFGGIYADRKGCTSSIRLGIQLMIGLMIFFGAITLFSEQLGSLAILAAAIGQILVGLPLALIDGADTVLTSKISRKVGVLSEEDGDYLEGICTQLKYSGIAAASFVGCFLYVAIPAWSKAQPALVGTIIFLLTAASQAFALRQLRRVQEPVASDQPGTAMGTTRRQMLDGLRSALQAIYSDKILATWILIVAVTEGWLIFAAYYFQLDAMGKLIEAAREYSIFIILTPVVYWLLAAVASFGGSYFNRWHKRAVKAARGEDRAVVLRGGSILDIPYVRLIAAGEILALMLGTFVVYLALSTIFPQGSEDGTYWLSLAPLVFYAAYQFLRGYAHPLLKTTLTNMVASRSLPNPVTTLSLASAAGRSFHMISALLFWGCLTWIKKEKGVSVTTATEALVATVVIVVLTIVILNVICSIALDRKNKEPEEPPRPPLKDIASAFSDRSFRSTVVKGAFFVCLAMSNVLAPKFSAMGFLDFNTGVLPYALTFMLVAAIAETEGKGSSRRLWLAGICTYFIVGFLVSVAVSLPQGRSQVQAGGSFDALFQTGLACILGSLCSFTVAQYMDIWLFLLLKKVTGGRALWLRSNLSTFISQSVDTVIFIGVASIAFHPASLLDFFTLVRGQLGMKWILSLLYTPMLYLIVRWIENGKEPGSPPAIQGLVDSSRAPGVAGG